MPFSLIFELKKGTVLESFCLIPASDHNSELDRHPNKFSARLYKDGKPVFFKHFSKIELIYKDHKLQIFDLGEKVECDSIKLFQF